MGVHDHPRKGKKLAADPCLEPPESAANKAHLVGAVGVGLPFEAVEAQETISIPLDMMRKKNICVMQVKGDSMMGDHLFDGDHLILEKRNTPRDGEMVVALTGNSEAVLRRFYREGHRIRLEPANPSCQAMVFDEKNVTIQGVVVGILRKYRG